MEGIPKIIATVAGGNVVMIVTRDMTVTTVMIADTTIINDTHMSTVDHTDIIIIMVGIDNLVGAAIRT